MQANPMRTRFGAKRQIVCLWAAVSVAASTAYQLQSFLGSVQANAVRPEGHSGEDDSDRIGLAPVPELAVGQEFVYEASLTTSLSSGPKNTKEKLQVRLHGTVVSGSDQTGWKLAYATSTVSDGPVNFVGQQPHHGFDYLHVTQFGQRHSGGHPLFRIGQFVLPPFLNSSTVLGKAHWLESREVRADGRVPVKVVYAGGARKQDKRVTYSQILVAHSGPLPASYESLGFHEGADPPLVTLNKFSGELWVDDKTGWLVQASYHLEATLPIPGRPVDSKNPKCRVETDYVLRLENTARLDESETNERDRQAKALCEIDRSFGHFYRNAALDAERILKQVDTFENEFPASPFAEIVASYRKRAEQQLASKVRVPFQPAIGGPLAGRVAADFNWKAADGSHVKLSNFRGRPVVLLFFVSRLAVGQRAFRDLQKWSHENRNKGVHVVAIKLHHRNASREVEDVEIAEPEIPTIDDRDDISSKYNILSDVNVIVLDPQQRIQYFRTALYPTELTAELNKLLNKEPTGDK